MTNYKQDVKAILKAIEVAGGVKELAIKLGISYQSVLDWKNQRRVPSHLNCLKIEKATDGKVNRKDILPDYPWE
jgi:DNA-binding transcriptional regulator YdaS (Cro superfamily)